MHPTKEQVLKLNLLLKLRSIKYLTTSILEITITFQIIKVKTQGKLHLVFLSSQFYSQNLIISLHLKTRFTKIFHLQSRSSLLKLHYNQTTTKTWLFVILMQSAVALLISITSSLFKLLQKNNFFKQTQGTNIIEMKDLCNTQFKIQMKMMDKLYLMIQWLLSLLGVKRKQWDR